MKSYTDLEQSRKLAKILPHRSADQTWGRIAIAGANLNVPEELQYRHNGDIPFQYYSGIGIPCWSLASLLGILPKGYSLGRRTTGKYYVCMTHIKHNISEFDNPIDACYEMIIRLHELNML